MVTIIVADNEKEVAPQAWRPRSTNEKANKLRTIRPALNVKGTEVCGARILTIHTVVLFYGLEPVVEAL